MSLGRFLPRWALHRGVLILVVSLAGVFASQSATAVAVGAVCTGGGQLCNNISTFPLTVGSKGGARGVKFISSSPAACSSVRIHFLVDGTEVGISDFVGPGGRTGLVSLGFLPAGKHTIGARAEGELGGCNIGNLVSWAGNVRIKKKP
jgi:hypothetical protein